jgi:hypothetical protein
MDTGLGLSRIHEQFPGARAEEEVGRLILALSPG